MWDLTIWFMRSRLGWVRGILKLVLCLFVFFLTGLHSECSSSTASGRKLSYFRSPNSSILFSTSCMYMCLSMFNSCRAFGIFRISDLAFFICGASSFTDELDRARCLDDYVTRICLSIVPWMPRASPTAGRFRLSVFSLILDILEIIILALRLFDGLLNRTLDVCACKYHWCMFSL